MHTHKTTRLKHIYTRHELLHGVIENSECKVPNHEGINLWLNFNLAYEMMHSHVTCGECDYCNSSVYSIYVFVPTVYAVGNT